MTTRFPTHKSAQGAKATAMAANFNHRGESAVTARLLIATNENAANQAIPSQ